MTLYLLHLDQDGSAVGAWDESGAHYYLSGHEGQRRRGELRWSNRGSAPSEWADYVEFTSGTGSPFARWAGFESDRPDLEGALSVYNQSLVSPAERAARGGQVPSPKVEASVSSSQEDDLISLAQQLLDRARNF